MTTTDSGTFLDPWPSLQPSWPDAPWTMTGRVLTAWFRIPPEALRELLSPSLIPDANQLGLARLRFYDVEFHSDDRDTRQTPDGHFREAVIALPAAYKGQVGEISAFMWSDSDTYMLWGREVFGWPILRGRVELNGSLWDGKLVKATTGEAHLELTDGGGAEITIDAVGEQLSEPAPPAWMTPRLVPEPASRSQRRQLLVVRPTLIEPGELHEATGKLTLDFQSSHPLAELRPQAERIDVRAGFVLRVGDQVDLL
jgi:hypothetical protein